MATWPSTLSAPSFGLFEEEMVKAQVQTSFEAGYVQSRAKHTRARRRWPKLGWQGMPESELAILENFFTANQGGSFTWTHPVTEAEYTVRFACDQVQSQVSAPGHRKIGRAHV